MSWGVDDLTVRFGDDVALYGVSVTIEPGVVQAVIGGDGAGKSTLLRVLAGLGLDHEGRVRLPPPNRVGYVPSTGGTIPDLTVAENMAFIAGAYRLRNWRDRADGLLERAGIAPFGDRLAGQLSGGQRRKLAGSMGLLPEPALLVLDEVTTGVDPISRVDLWRIVASAAAAGTAVVVATTYLDEAERAERVELLHAGRQLASGSPSAIVGAIPGRITDEATPLVRATAWRRGRRWCQWHPGERHDPGSPAGHDATRPGYRPTLEDAAIVLELVADGERS